MAPIFRSDQVGSLLRPAKLLAARQGRANYQADVDQELRRETQEAINEAVKKQLDLGIRPLTSGEFDREIFYGGFFEKLSGMIVEPALPIPGAFRPGFPTADLLVKLGVKSRPAVIATGKISHVEPIYLDGWEMLKKALPEDKWHEGKIAMPSPTWEHMQLKKGTAFTPEAYASDREYFIDLAAAFRKELEVLYRAGLRSVQVDDPNLTFFVVDTFLEACKADGVDPDELLDLYIWVHNECLKGRPRDLHVGVHLCRGNFPNATNVSAGSYEKIAQKAFNNLDYDSFYLEFDDARSGSFEPLRLLPQGKVVVLGLVTTKHAELEGIIDLEKRVHEAAEIIAKGQGRTKEEVLKDTISVSPQCGFASQSKGRGEGMTEERQWEKLLLVKNLALKVWGSLV